MSFRRLRAAGATPSARAVYTAVSTRKATSVEEAILLNGRAGARIRRPAVE